MNKKCLLISILIFVIALILILFFTLYRTLDCSMYINDLKSFNKELIGTTKVLKTIALNSNIKKAKFLQLLKQNKIEFIIKNDNLIMVDGLIIEFEKNRLKSIKYLNNHLVKD